MCKGTHSEKPMLSNRNLAEGASVGGGKSRGTTFGTKEKCFAMFGLIFGILGLGTLQPIWPLWTFGFSSKLTSSVGGSLALSMLQVWGMQEFRRFQRKNWKLLKILSFLQASWLVEKNKSVTVEHWNLCKSSTGILSIAAGLSNVIKTLPVLQDMPKTACKS